MKAIELKCEYLDNPVGIDVTAPRFFWKCNGGKTQSAYQIICEREGKTIWDTGKVASCEMTHIPYRGKSLQSRDRVNWKVLLWDEADAPGEWSEAYFEMGLLEETDWTAKWIRGDYKVKKHKRYPVDCFRKQIRLAQGTVHGAAQSTARGATQNGAQSSSPNVIRARLYITACGLYEARIDGQRVGDFCLAPGSTDYRKRIQYQTYDVTDMFTCQTNDARTSVQSDTESDVPRNENDATGNARSDREHTLEIQLADGWYRGSVAAHGLTKAYGSQTKLLFQLELTYADHSSQYFGSDSDTEWSNDGPIRFADLKDGEIYDANRHASYSGKAVACEEPKGKLAASNNVIPKKMETFTATEIVTPGGKHVLDFGQNIAGFISFKLNGKKGQKVKLLMGEILDQDGEFTQKNFQLMVPKGDMNAMTEFLVTCGMYKEPADKTKLKPTPMQRVTFICSGGEDEYCTTFAVFGFRYALIETEADYKPEDFCSIAVYSAMEETGSFSCSNKKVNQFYKNTLWSMKGNYLDVPTDCPTRERLGWTGDAQVFFNTGAYMMNTASFFQKWMKDVTDAQDDKGKIPAVMPFSRGTMMYNSTGVSVGWADAIYLLPYRYYKMYGDKNILADNYPAMKKYADFLLKNTGHKDKKAAKEDPYDKYVYEKGIHLGEWLEPAEFVEEISNQTATKLVHTEECTAYFHLTMDTMEEIAQILGKTDDAALFHEYAEGSKKAYDNLFLQTVPDTDRQAKLVRPLALGCVPDEKIDAVANRLFTAVTNRGYRIGTGFLSTPFVLKTLTENGRADLAYKMLENEEAPSWLAEVNAGATTVWEDWQGDASHNHYSPGAVCEWMFDTILGINVTGERHFTVRPVPGGTLDHAEGNYNSIYGNVTSGWKRKDGKVTYEITIPENTTATIVIDGKATEVEAGTYQFETVEP